MNPLTNIKNINKLNETEERLGINPEKSWHYQYKDSAYVYVGGLPFDLSEGDIICVFSQYGEIMDINLVRDKKTGKSRGFCFICYEDQKSTILAVDNFNGIKLLGRTIRVDHVADYKRPKDTGEEDALTLKLRLEGVGPDSEIVKTKKADDIQDINEDISNKVKHKKRKRRRDESIDHQNSDSSKDSKYRHDRKLHQRKKHHKKKKKEHK